MTLEELFAGFNSQERKVSKANIDDLGLFFSGNLVQIVIVEGRNETRTTVVSSNRALIDKFMGRINRDNKIKPSKDRGHKMSENTIKAFDFISAKPFSIPVTKRWKAIRWTAITENNIDEINDRMKSVFRENRKTSERKGK